MNFKRYKLILISLLNCVFTQYALPEQVNLSVESEKLALSKEIKDLCEKLIYECKNITFHQNISFNNLLVQNVHSLKVDSSIVTQINVLEEKTREWQNDDLLYNKSYEELAKVKNELATIIQKINILKAEYCNQKNNSSTTYNKNLTRCLSTILKVLISTALSKLAEDSILAPLTHLMKMYYLCSLIFNGWTIISSSTDAIAHYAVKNIPANTIKSSL